MSKDQPAFPHNQLFEDGSLNAVHEGMTLRDYFAAHAPLPDKEYIDFQKQIDKSRNPHNDSYKPKIRTVIEIIAGYKFEYADAMLEQRDK